MELKTEYVTEQEIQEIKQFRLEAILAAQQHLISQHSSLMHRSKLDEFVFYGQKKGSAREAIIAYLHGFRPHMKKPVLHLWGKTGTGKTHLATALAAYLILNHWQDSTRRIATFAYVDWGSTVQKSLEENTPPPEDFEADLMIFEGLDDQPPIPKSHDTFRLDQACNLLKERLEINKLSTIITTRHHPTDLLRYLTLNTQGEEIASAYESAENLVGLIAGSTLARGLTGETSFKLMAIRDLGTPTLKNRQPPIDFVPAAAGLGLAVIY